MSDSIKCLEQGCTSIGSDSRRGNCRKCDGKFSRMIARGETTDAELVQQGRRRPKKKRQPISIKDTPGHNPNNAQSYIV